LLLLQSTPRLKLLFFTGKGAEPSALLSPPGPCHLPRAGLTRGGN